jgi:hypothetical protein
VRRRAAAAGADGRSGNARTSRGPDPATTASPGPAGPLTAPARAAGQPPAAVEAAWTGAVRSLRGVRGSRAITAAALYRPGATS